jgi:hypothetical protein
MWLAPALLASLGLAALVGLSMGDQSNLAVHVLGLGSMSLIFTLGGSALLGLVFAWTWGRGVPLAGRYVVQVLVGALAGGALLLPAGTASAALIGGTYGLVTACVWVLTHWMLYRATTRVEG